MAVRLSPGCCGRGRLIVATIHPKSGTSLVGRMGLGKGGRTNCHVDRRRLMRTKGVRFVLGWGRVGRRRRGRGYVYFSTHYTTINIYTDPCKAGL